MNELFFSSEEDYNNVCNFFDSIVEDLNIRILDLKKKMVECSDSERSSLMKLCDSYTAIRNFVERFICRMHLDIPFS